MHSVGSVLFIPPSYLPTSSSLILSLEIDLTSKLNPRSQREEIMRTDFVLFFVDDAVVVASLAGSLVGNLLPRLMLHERGVSPSSVKFAKTEANKPYICTVRHLLSLPVRGSTGCDKWEPYFFFFTTSSRNGQSTPRVRACVLLLSPDNPLSNRLILHDVRNGRICWDGPSRSRTCLNTSSFILVTTSHTTRV